MDVEYVIIGHGIAGTMLSHEMQKAGISFILIDDPLKSAASKVASGIINPVTGRRIVETWMINKLMRSSFAVYRELEVKLGIDCLRECSVLDFFPTAQMRLAFTDRITEGSDYLFLPSLENDWLEYLNYDLGYGIIQPAYLVDINALLTAHRSRLIADKLLLETAFVEQQLILSKDKIQYGDLRASRLIFCDGAAGSSSKYFRRLPFALNKGEALIVEMPGLP
ncbi:MAG: FAD-dependent oxidoreductase, partial [Chitinophagaceae bacterium]